MRKTCSRQTKIKQINRASEVFVKFFIFIPMSGLFTPINSMPEWAQVTTWFNPLKYFIEVMRKVYLKGSPIVTLYRQLFALLNFCFCIQRLGVNKLQKEQLIKSQKETVRKVSWQLKLGLKP